MNGNVRSQAKQFIIFIVYIYCLLKIRFMKKTILVTGGAGYIGSHACKLLAKNDFIPVAYDNLMYGHRSFAKYGPFVEGDISDHGALCRVFETYQPEAVIHFAACSYVGESVKNPSKYYQNNVTGTLSLLDVMRKYDCKKIIFSSTCATYGVSDTSTIDESLLQNPINPYGKSKLMIEQILADYDTAYGTKYVILRYFNAAGADPGGGIGEDHNPETHLIPLIIAAALKRRKAIEVYGTDYPTPDGTAIRDYVHVNDLANAHIKALGFLENYNKSDFFNIGTGAGNSVQNIIDTVTKVSGISVPVSYGERRVGDPHTLVASFQKASEILGWESKYSSIDNIIKTAWNWHSRVLD